MKRVMGLWVAMMALVAVVMVGCEGGGGDGDNTSDINGTWALYSGSTIAYYIHFSNGTYYMSQNADGTAVDVTDGTYTITDGFITGPFVNPGVGDGRIDATVTDGVMALDFVEYWGSGKTYSFTGTKI
jgi:hypothetical protein